MPSNKRTTGLYSSYVLLLSSVGRAMCDETRPELTFDCPGNTNAKCYYFVSERGDAFKFSMKIPDSFETSCETRINRHASDDLNAACDKTYHDFFYVPAAHFISEVQQSKACNGNASTSILRPDDYAKLQSYIEGATLWGIPAVNPALNAKFIDCLDGSFSHFSQQTYYKYHPIVLQGKARNNRDIAIFLTICPGFVVWIPLLMCGIPKLYTGAKIVVNDCIVPSVKGCASGVSASCSFFAALPGLAVDKVKDCLKRNPEEETSSDLEEEADENTPMQLPPPPYSK